MDDAQFTSAEGRQEAIELVANHIVDTNETRDHGLSNFEMLASHQHDRLRHDLVRIVHERVNGHLRDDLGEHAQASARVGDAVLLLLVLT